MRKEDFTEFIVKRLYKKKDQLLESSKNAIDLWEERNIVELKKELRTISHCISELEPFATKGSKKVFSILDELMDKLNNLIELYQMKKVGWDVTVTLYLNGITTMANSISVKPTKKGLTVYAKGKVPNLAELGIEHTRDGI